MRNTMKAKKNLANQLLEGAIIGAVGIIPGASGGVLAVAFGIYRNVIDAVAGLTRDFRRNFLFLLPYGIGGAVGMLSTARLLEWLLENWRIPLMYLLIGLVLGGIPSIIRSAGVKFSPKYAVFALLGGLLTIALAMLNDGGASGGYLEFTHISAFISGAIITIGIIIPGVSTSFVLMYLGWYEPLLCALNRIQLSYLTCAGAGALIVAALLISFVKRMFHRYPTQASYCILGFLLGTVIMIFPGFSSGTQLVFHLLLCATGIACTLLLQKCGKS